MLTSCSTFQSSSSGLSKRLSPGLQSSESSPIKRKLAALTLCILSSAWDSFCPSPVRSQFKLSFCLPDLPEWSSPLLSPTCWVLVPSDCWLSALFQIHRPGPPPVSPSESWPCLVLLHCCRPAPSAQRPARADAQHVLGPYEQGPGCACPFNCITGG